MYIKRTIENILPHLSATFPVVMLTGPRQVGKSTMLERCADKSRRMVSLDHPLIRARAQEDPELFLQTYPPPVLIDEIQYAPQLFPFIKIIADKSKKNGLFWLTGSQQFSMMREVSESLAGRVAIVEMLGLSQRELSSSNAAQPLLDFLQNGALPAEAPAMQLQDVYSAIFNGFFPALHKKPRPRFDLFYSSYVKTYIERDIRSLLNITHEAAFLRFMTVIAARTGQMLNYNDLARDVDLSPNTIKAWLSLLVSSRLVYLLRPYHSNLASRTVKTPKLYFTDTGLCAYLAGWSSPATLEAGAMSGAILETYAVMEIVKSFWHNGREAPVYYYRDKDRREIDLLMEIDGVLHPIEIKKTANPGKNDVRHFSALSKQGVKSGHGAIISLATERILLSRDVSALNIADI